jgi:hypothetical protein
MVVRGAGADDARTQAQASVDASSQGNRAEIRVILMTENAA